MILEKLEIASFGKLDNMTLELSSGVNIIRGANESGKSTICDFIRFIFYGLPSDKTEKFRHISWSTSSCRGAITLKNDDGIRYRVERDLVCITQDGKYQFKEKVVVRNVVTNETVLKNECPGEYFFGVPDCVFDNTVYIRQIDGTRVGDKTLSEAAENILFSGDESINTKKAIKALDEARVALYHKSRKAGLIYDLTAERDAVADKMEQSMKASTEIISLEGTARQLSEKMNSAQARAKTIKSELDNYEQYAIKKTYFKYKELLRNAKQIDAQIDDIRFAAQFNNAPVYSDDYIEKMEKLRSSLDAAAVRVEESSIRLSGVRKKINDMSEKVSLFEKFGKKNANRDELVEKAAAANATLTKLKFASKIVIGVCALFAVAFILMIMPGLIPEIGDTGNINKILLIVFGVTTVLAALSFCVIKAAGMGPASVLRRICKKFGCRNYTDFEMMTRAAAHDVELITFITDERDAAEGALATASDNLDEINNNIITELKSANFTIEKSTASSIETALKICRDQKSQFEKLMIVKSKNDADIASAQDSLNSYDDEYIRAACNMEFDESALDGYNYSARKRDYEFLVNSIASQTERLHDIEKELAALTAITPRPAEFAEQKEILDRRIADLTEKFDAYMLAVDSMNAAGSKLRDGLAPKISKNASALMSSLSASKYQTLGVDSEFGMTFTADTQAHNVDMLSAGTTDIAYISLRLALIDVLYRQSVPPFIFDESFMRMDNERLKNSLSMLVEFGSGGAQSLLFTCHGREEKMMKTVGEYTYFCIDQKK
ncbi:MAG: AAA family ATPase [Clostridia bacterium]|nr:AAA family ATPase [Clostridia bacterium]